MSNLNFLPAQQVSTCQLDLQAKVQSIAEFANKTLFVLDDNELLDKIKGAKFPAAGIVYEGMRALPESGQSKIGITAELVFSILVVSRAENLANSDQKTPLLNLLDGLRNAIATTRAPTGHHWKFVVEAGTKESNGAVFWVQRWSTILNIVTNGGHR